MMLTKVASGPVEEDFWPTSREIALTVVLASIVTAIDIIISMQIGLLARPPYYDGIAYVMNAKSMFYQMNQFQFDLLHVDSFLFWYAPLWQALMVLSFLLLGEGEWQAYSARFWPTLLLLLLVAWVVRRQGGGRVAWVAVIFTSMLPIVSVNLRTSNYFSPSYSFLGWYLGDQRPDFLFVMLLLWAVVPLIERVHRLDRLTWFLSGLFAGLALLAKSSELPLLGFVLGLTAAYVFLINRSQLAATIMKSLWSLVPFMAMLLLWALKGGLEWLNEYYYANLIGPGRALYSNPNATFLSEAIYYWKLFPDHIGQVESWTMLGIGLTLAAVTLWKGKRHTDSRIICYLGLSLAIYVLVSAIPNKNYFIGIPYYLLLWLISWITLAPLLKKWSARSRMKKWILVLVLCTYVGFNLVGGLYGLYNWPVWEQRAAEHNKHATQQIAADLRALLRNNDLFISAPAFGYPNALQYYMIDSKGKCPNTFNLYISKPPDQVIRESISNCKAILVYEQDIDEVARFASVPAPARPYWQAIAEWVRDPQNSYELFKKYDFFFYDAHRLTMNLYVKRSSTDPSHALQGIETQNHQYWKQPDIVFASFSRSG